MKKLKIILILLMGIILVGCTKDSIEVFRFVNHEIIIEVGQQTTIDLIYGEYATNSNVNFYIDQDDIISLEDNVVTGIAAGEVKITATIDYEKYAYMIVKVINTPISSMKINTPKNVNYVYANESLNLTVKVNPEKVSNEVTWSLENNTRNGKIIASISETGELKGLKGEQNDPNYPKEGVPIIVVATSKIDPIMSAKREIYVKYRP